MPYFKFSSLLLVVLTFSLSCANQDSASNANENKETKPKTITKQAPATQTTNEKAQAMQNIQTKPSTANPAQVAKPKVEPKIETTPKLNPTPKPSPSPSTPTTQTTTQIAIPATATLKGKVILQDSRGNVPSSEGALIELKRINKATSVASSTNKNYAVDTRSKTYLPGFLSVKVGDTLVFKNYDGIKHNVFSSSGKNTFDLGTYGYNRERSYTVANEGVIKVYCNIHPEMALFVSASHDNLSYITDNSGEYTIKNLAPGKYTLSVWHLRGTTEKIIEIKSKETKIENLTIDISSYQPEEHLNKHGEAYKKKPAIFKDEFY